MTPAQDALWDAVHQLWAANDVLDRCGVLFRAIQLLEGEEAIALARLGQSIAEEWAGDLEDHCKQLAGSLCPDPQYLAEQGGGDGQDQG